MLEQSHQHWGVPTQTTEQNYFRGRFNKNKEFETKTLKFLGTKYRRTIIEQLREELW